MPQATRNPLDPSARLLSEAIAELGWNADPKELAERVRRLQLGLPAEDEFALLLSWLGKCVLVHRLDQLQVPPDSKAAYRVPDLFAVFRHNDREIATLVEVKTSAERQLSWRPDYYEALRRYAELLGLPLLLAWDWTKLGFWALCDISLFEREEKNYHLAYKTAMRHSLMCELAGDFSYVFQPGVGVHFKFEKIEKLPPEAPNNESWHLRVEEAYYTDGAGNRLNTLGPGIWWMFLGAEQETETEDHPGHFDHRFVMTDHSPMQAAHRLLALVTVGLGADQPVQWRKLLEEHSFAIDGAALAAEARSAIERHIVRYVFHQQPAKIPAFLK